MLNFRYSNVVVLALVLLLGIQLTGLTCLGEWPLRPADTQVEMTDFSPPPDENVINDGCPCHFVFQSVLFADPEILSPHIDGVSSSPMLYVPTFVVFLFHPPLSV